MQPRGQGVQRALLLGGEKFPEVGGGWLPACLIPVLRYNQSTWLTSKMNLLPTPRHMGELNFYELPGSLPATTTRALVS